MFHSEDNIGEEGKRKCEGAKKGGEKVRKKVGRGETDWSDESLRHDNDGTTINLVSYFY